MLAFALTTNENKIVSTNTAMKLKVWDLPTLSYETMFEGHNSRSLQASVNLDGSLIVSGDGDGIVKVWDSETQECIKTIKVGNSSVKV